MTLAYSGASEYGGGFAAPEEPLSERGRQLLRTMAETGMVLDLSHAGHRTARDALDLIEQKALALSVVATHTACHAVYDHGRAMPDDVLTGISDLGGLVGLVTVTWLLHGTDNGLEPFLGHLEHLLELVGEKHTCLGTDGVYRYINPEEDKRRFEVLKAKIDPTDVFHARCPEQPAELNRPDRLAVLEAFLQSQGWQHEYREPIMGGNLIKFLSTL